VLVVVVCRLFGDEVIPAICPLEVSVVVFIVATSMEFELAVVCIVVLALKTTQTSRQMRSKTL